MNKKIAVIAIMVVVVAFSLSNLFGFLSPKNESAVSQDEKQVVCSLADKEMPSVWVAGPKGEGPVANPEYIKWQKKYSECDMTNRARGYY
jgi:hypothetical protein